MSYTPSPSTEILGGWGQTGLGVLGSSGRTDLGPSPRGGSGLLPTPIPKRRSEPEQLYCGYTVGGQFVSVDQLELVHSGRDTAVVTVDRAELKLDREQDVARIIGITAALLSMLPQEVAASLLASLHRSAVAT